MKKSNTCIYSIIFIIHIHTALRQLLGHSRKKLFRKQTIPNSEKHTINLLNEVKIFIKKKQRMVNSNSTILPNS